MTTEEQLSLWHSTVMTPDAQADEHTIVSWAKEHADEPLAVDTETTGLSWHDTVRLVQFGDGDTGYSVDVFDEEGRGIVRQVLAEHAGPLIFHNAPFDISKLEKVGVDPFVLWDSAVDTYVMAHVLDSSRRNGLDALTRTVLEEDDAVAGAGYKKSFRTWMRKNKYSFADVPLIALTPYGVRDTVSTHRLHSFLSAQLTDTERYVVGREMEVARLMWEFPYRHGMRLDREYALGLQAQWSSDLAADRAWFKAEHGVENPNANAQLIDSLMAQGWKPKAVTEATGAPKLDKAILETLRTKYPMVERLMEYKRKTKWLASYVENCLENADDFGYVHASYNTLGARTGRMSCSNPPLQQLPKGGGGEVRRLFVAAEGNVIASIDYSAIEFRLAGHFSGERRIIDVYKRGGDWYQQVANDVGISRPEAKILVLALTYGAGAPRISSQLRMPLPKARGLVTNFWKSYPALEAWVQEISARVGLGTPLLSSWGRVLRPHADYAGPNAIIQGTAAEVMKNGLLRLRDADLMQHVVAVVHDEVVIDVPIDDAERIAKTIADVLEDDSFDCPLVAEASVYGKSWGHGYS